MSVYGTTNIKADSMGSFGIQPRLCTFDQYATQDSEMPSVALNSQEHLPASDALPKSSFAVTVHAIYQLHMHAVHSSNMVLDYCKI